jgi:hypothetical protein
MKTEMLDIPLPPEARTFDFASLRVGGPAMAVKNCADDAAVRSVRMKMKTFEKNNEGVRLYSKAISRGAEYAGQKFDSLTLLVWRAE